MLYDYMHTRTCARERIYISTPEGLFMAYKFDPIEEIIAELQQGRMVIVTDDENRENEGDLIAAASLCTPETINFMPYRHCNRSPLEARPLFYMIRDVKRDGSFLNW